MATTVNKGLEVYIRIDKTLIYFIAAGSEKSYTEIATNLLELSHRSVTRMENHGGSYRTNHFLYPGTKIELTAKVELSNNYNVMQEDRLAYFQRFADQFGLDIKDIQNSTYENHFRLPDVMTVNMENWLDNNEDPRNSRGNPRYKMIVCNIKLRNEMKPMEFTRTDIDNFLIENILLGGE